jgi:hypothetical protein
MIHVTQWIINASYNQQLQFCHRTVDLEPWISVAKVGPLIPMNFAHTLR